MPGDKRPSRTQRPTKSDVGNSQGSDDAPTRNRLGDFELLSEIGRGGMGVVYEARQISLNRRVALKVLPPGLGLTPQAVQRFEREAHAAAKLHHTNIVPVYATGKDDGCHYYAMELIEGQPLSDVLKDLSGTGTNPLMDKTVTQFGEDEEPTESTPDTSPAISGITSLSDTQSGGRKWFDAVAGLITEVADALEYAHGRGVIHRDIKPANLMLSSDGKLCITDFGLARVAQEPGMTVSGSLMGTPAYMSPEQITAGRVKLDHRTDVYSLGAVLYEMLTHQRPFPGESREEVLSGILTKDPRPPRRFNPRVPVDLETICLKAMEKDPDKRYGTAGEFAGDLRQYLGHGLIQARRAGVTTRAWKSIRRHPVAAVSILAAVIVFSIGGVAWNAMRKADVPHLVSEANLALERGDYRKGLEAAERALELQPGMPEARIVRARLLLNLVRYDEVVAEARAILDENPDDWAAHFILAYVSKGGSAKNEDRPSIPMADHLSAVERLAPESADVHFLHGLLAKSESKAIEHYTRALELDPGHTWALAERSHKYANVRDFEAAKADAVRQQAIRPRSAHGWQNLGCVYRKEREFERAEAEFAKAIEIDPDDPDSYWERAALYTDLRRHEDAIADLTRAIEIGPARPEYYRSRGWSYYRAGRMEEAIADARRSLELNPDLPSAFHVLLLVYQNLDLLDEFEQTADELRHRAAGWADSEARADGYQRLASLYHRAGDHERALVEADRAVEADPGHLQARIQRIKVLRALNDQAGFETECDALAALDLVDPGPSEIRANQIGWTCQRWEQALEHLTPLIEDHPGWARPYFDRGTAHYFLSHYGECLADLSRAIELDPQYAQAYTNRAVAYDGLYRYAESEADRNKVLELEPRNTTNLGNMAGRHLTLGQQEAALEDIDRAIAVDPMYAWGHRLRASINNALGRFEDAAADARRSIDIDSTQPWAYVQLLNAHEGLKDDERMRAVVEELRSAANAWVDDETAAWGFVNASNNLRFLDDYGPALDAADRAIERDPGNPWGFIVRARVRLDQSDRRGFRTDCNTAAGIERESLNDRVWDAQGLGNYCTRWEYARSELVRVQEEDPRHIDAWFWRGRADLRLGRADDALAAFDELVRMDGEHPRGYIERALVHGVRADCARALADLEKARELVAERLESRADEVWIHTAVLFHTCPQDYDGPAALDLAQGVVAVNPRKWEYQLPLAMALYRHGRFEEALAALEEALTLDAEPANEPLRLFPLAMTQTKLGRGDEARATYDRAVTLMNETSPRYPAFVLLRDEAGQVVGAAP